MQGKRRSATDRRPLNSTVLNVRMTADQRRDLVAEAMEKGISISEVARARIFRQTSSGAAA
jgi:transposase-like protein